jgi:hypothetical protein
LNKLTDVVGSEKDIRIRQNMFLIKDKICNKVHTELTQVSSGLLIYQVATDQVYDDISIVRLVVTRNASESRNIHGLIFV